LVESLGVNLVVAAALLLSARSQAVAAPVEELFLGETPELNDAGQLQLRGGLTRHAGRMSSPLEIELGILDHVEASTELPLDWGDMGSSSGSAALHVGTSVRQLTARFGAERAWGSERMTSAWAGTAALGVTHGRVALYASGELGGDGLSCAAGAALSIGVVVPVVEISYEGDERAVAAGAVWRLTEDLELGGAVIVDSERQLAWSLQLVTEIEMFARGAR
jgi:hypothetical protein